MIWYFLFVSIGTFLSISLFIYFSAKADKPTVKSKPAYTTLDAPYYFAQDKQDTVKPKTVRNRPVKHHRNDGKDRRYDTSCLCNMIWFGGDNSENTFLAVRLNGSEYSGKDWILMQLVANDSLCKLNGRKGLPMYYRMAGDTITVFYERDTATILYSGIANKFGIKAISDKQ